MKELIHRVALSIVPGVGIYTVRQLLTYCGSVEQIFKTPTGKLTKIPGIRDHITHSLKNPDLFHQAEAIIRQCQKFNINISFITDIQYPKRLKEIVDAPIVIYTKGYTETEQHKTISIVGTRKCSVYGKNSLKSMLEQLVPWNPVVISGLAYGIDITAHKLCLELGLRTIGVLGSGIQYIYPTQHQSIAESMCEQGGLISEYPPLTKPEIYHFPARNRIIAGLSEGVLVAEAGEKGGALITAQLANSYHREVMAIPGNVSAPMSVGCNNLIKNNQAHLVTSGTDIAQILNWDIENNRQSKFKLKDLTLLESLSQSEQLLYHCIEKEECIQLDELAWKSQMSISQVANLVLQLEMNGLIQMLPGKKIKISS